MKAYVFPRVRCNWACGMGFAIANNLDEAKRLVMESAEWHPWSVAELNDVSEFDLDTPRAWSVDGGG